MVSTNDEIVSEAVAIATPTVDNGVEMKTITEDDFDKATKTFQLGKKNLFLNKYDESVNNIEEACKVYATKFGEMDSQCAEVYFFYGRALLELARVENTVLGNALSGVPEDNEPIDDSRYGNPDDVAADEKKEISDKVISALCDNNDEIADKKEETTTTCTETTPSTTTETTTPVEPMVAATAEKEPVVEAEISKETEAAIAEAVVEGDEEEEDEEDDEEDTEDLTKADEQAKDEAEAEEISNLQRAWEMFELAKLVYSKNFDSDLAFKNKRIAECLIKLGEISIEQELYEQAITDITESVKMQEAESAETRDERMLAESFYQLALAQQFANMFAEATESYQKAINIMKFRVEKLQAKMAAITATDSDAELEKNSMRDEIADLEALIPDMACKLEELTEQGQETSNMIKEVKDIFLNTMTEAVAAPINGDVKDITSMLKSKRKISSSSLEGSTKKTRTSDTEPEMATTEASTNGDAEMAPVSSEVTATTTTVDAAMPVVASEVVAEATPEVVA